MEKYETYTLEDGSPLTEAERWVLEQIEKGSVADLVTEYGPNYRQRYLRSRFIEKLLTDEFCNLKVYRHSIIIKNGLILEPINLANSDIKYNIQISSFIFNEYICLRDAVFTKHLYFDDSIFFGMVDCHRLKVGSNISFNYAVFNRPTNLSNIKVGLSAHFNNALFFGPVTFDGAEIGFQFYASLAIFKMDASFYGLKVGDYANFQGSIFEKFVNFSGANISKQFLCQKAKFTDSNAKLIFSTIKASDIILDDALFNGMLDFRGTEIQRQLAANNTLFLNKKEKAHFCGLKVGDSAYFRKVVFEGGICLNDCKIGDLIIGPAMFNKLEIQRTIIQRALEIRATEIIKLKANFLQVKGPANLEEVRINDEVDLQYSSYQTLGLIKIIWPKIKDAIILDGLIYNAITAGNGQEDWKELITLIEHSKYNIQNYSQLEAYFKHSGYKEIADKIYLKGKQRELKLRKGISKFIIKFFWDWLTGYGRRPAQVLWLIMPLLAFGAYLLPPEFEPRFLDCNQCSKEIIFFHPWLTKAILSLDRFLPGVNLGLAEHWQPSRISLFAWMYWYALKILGWITIPIVLAAIYTRIRD